MPKLNRLFPGGDCWLMHRLAPVRPPQPTVREGRVGIQLDRLHILFDCLIISARIEIDISQEGIGKSQERIQTNCSLQLGVGLLITSHRTKVETEQVMSRRVTRTQFKGPLKFSLSSQEVEVIHGGKSQRAVGLP